MNVVVVEPGYLPYEKEINGLSEKQAIVGGYITATYPYKNEAVSIVANDEGLLLNLPFNRSIQGGYGGIFGTFFICRIEEDRFCSLTPEQIERFKQEYAILLALPVKDGLVVGMPEKSRRTREVEAESITYIVCQHFGIEIGDSAFAYITRRAAIKSFHCIMSKNTSHREKYF